MLAGQSLVLGKVRRVGDDEVLIEFQEAGNFTDGQGVQQHGGDGNGGKVVHGRNAFQRGRDGVAGGVGEGGEDGGQAAR